MRTGRGQNIYAYICINGYKQQCGEDGEGGEGSRVWVMGVKEGK